MPILGLGVHFLIALYFAVHCVRSGRELYWLILLFSFPLLGSLVYFLAIYLPQSRLDRTIASAGRAVARKLDPGRAVREAQQAFDLTPTAHNQTRLAQALLDAGQAAEAVAQFDACLQGPFAGDPEIIFAAAQARLANGQAAVAVSALESLRRAHPGFRNEQLGMVLAQAYAGDGMQVEAGREFGAVVERFGGIEARTEYVLWALAQGQRATAQQHLKELQHARKHMNKYTLSLHQDLFKRLDGALQTHGLT